MKWLAIIGAVAVLGLLLLWREVQSDASPVAAPAVAPVATAVRVAPTGRLPGAPPRADDAPLPPHVRPAGTLAPEDDVGAIERGTEEFFERIDETYSRRLLGYAADCYKGGKERKQKLKVAFRFQIVSGTVSVRDLRIVESTLNDPALEACMAKAVAGATFQDPRMPDWSTAPQDEEEVLIRIETLKRFGPVTD